MVKWICHINQRIVVIFCIFAIKYLILFTVQKVPSVRRIGIALTKKERSDCFYFNVQNVMVVQKDIKRYRIDVFLRLYL